MRFFMAFLLLSLVGCGNEEISKPTSSSGFLVEPRLRLVAAEGTRSIILTGRLLAQNLPALQSGDTVECDRSAVIVQEAGKPVFVLTALNGVTLRGCRIEGLGVIEEDLKHSNGPSENIILVENSNDVLIEDMTLENVRGEAGIRIHRSTDILVDGVTIRDFSHRGIEVVGSSREITLSNNFITKSDSMLAAFADRRPAEVGIEISAATDEPYPQQVTVEGNTCQNLIHGTCYSARGGNQLRFVDNVAASIQCFSFLLRATRPAHGLSNLLVTGNRCVTVDDERSGQRYPVRVDGVVQRNAAGEVLFDYRQEGWGIRVGGHNKMTSQGLETIPARHITLSHNRVFSAALMGTPEEQRPGIGIQYALNVQAVGNHVSASGQNGIALVHVDSFSVYGNRIRSSGYAGIFLGLGNTLSDEGANYRESNVIEANFIDDLNSLSIVPTLWGISVARGVSSVGGLREGSNKICLSGNPDHQYQSNDYPEIVDILSLENCE